MQVDTNLKAQLSPPLDECWHLAFQFTPRGLTTGPIPYPLGTFEVDFSFIAHEVRVLTSRGGRVPLALPGHSVADFYRELSSLLSTLGVGVIIDPSPGDEFPNAMELDRDEAHASYHPRGRELR